MKKYPWKKCSNLILPQYPQGLLTMKRKMLGKLYKGRGRPCKLDYEYKSILDIQFEIDTIFNKQIDNKYLSQTI